MTTQAAIGYGTKYEIDNPANPGAWLAIAEIKDLTPPNEQADVIEATNFDSPAGYKEFILGLTDPGDVTFTMNLVPGSASETALLAAKAARKAFNARIPFPNAVVWTFAHLITHYQPSVPVEGIMTCTVTAKVTGSVVHA